MYLLFIFCNKHSLILLATRSERNVALYKPATQKSTHNNLYAYRSVDGNFDTYAKTEENAPGEWAVDLEGAFTISRIQFTNAYSRKFDIFLAF